MRDGCAGFFTEAALAAGKGIVRRPLDLRTAARRPARRLGTARADGRRVVRRRAGRRPPPRRSTRRRSARCSPGLPLADPLRLPGGRMTLVEPRHAPRPDGRPVRPRPDPRRAGHPARRLVPDLPLRRRPRDARHADVRVLPAHAPRLPDAAGLGGRGAARSRSSRCRASASRLKCRGQVIESTRQGGLRAGDQGDRLPPRALRDRRRPDVRRRQAGRRGHRHVDPAHRPDPRVDRGASGTGRRPDRCRPTVVSHRRPLVSTANTSWPSRSGKPSEAFGDRYRAVRRGPGDRPAARRRRTRSSTG